MSKLFSEQMSINPGQLQNQTTPGNVSNIHGWVDGINNGELQGWIVNRNRPSKLEYIICAGERGTRRFFPATMRADVCAVLGIEGVFGFSIPVDLLNEVGENINIEDRNGNRLENGCNFYVGSVTSSISEEISTNIFLHIPKTAGTSLRRGLLASISPGEKVLIYPGRTPGISPEALCRLPLYQRNKLRWIFGHCSFGIGRFLVQPSQYVTFIRETSDRLHSNFNHHASLGTIFEIDGEIIPVFTVVNEGMTEEFDNISVRMIAGLSLKEVPLGTVGEDELELALNNIRKYFSFVGQQSQAVQDFSLLRELFPKCSHELSFDNVTSGLVRYHENDATLVNWSTVMRRNWVDDRLYQVLIKENLLSRTLERPG